MNGREFRQQIEANRSKREKVEREFGSEFDRVPLISRSTLFGVFAVALILGLVVWTLAWSAPLTAPPRIVAYHGGSSGGAPFVKADGTLDDALIRDTARYPIVTVNPNAAALRPDFVARLRYYNPNIFILFYHQLTNWHIDSTWTIPPSDTTFYAEQQRALNWSHGWIPTAGSYSGFPIDWKQEDVADTLTRLWVKHTKRMRPDGWFFDYFNVIAGGAFGINEDDDYNRLYNVRRMIAAMRAAQPGILLFANGPGGYGADRCDLDGGMNENFPNGTNPFTAAIKQNPGMWLKSESPIGTSGNATLAAYTLGVACMTGAYSEHGNSHYTGAPEQGTWWFPFYSVDANGNADPTGRCTGWLVAEEGAPTKITSTTWRRHFVKGCVALNTGSTAANVPLGGTYRLIGSQTNITNTTVPAFSAVFLWKP